MNKHSAVRNDAELAGFPADVPDVSIDMPCLNERISLPHCRHFSPAASIFPHALRTLLLRGFLMAIVGGNEAGFFRGHGARDSSDKRYGAG